MLSIAILRQSRKNSNFSEKKCCEICWTLYNEIKLIIQKCQQRQYQQEHVIKLDFAFFPNGSSFRTIRYIIFKNLYMQCSSQKLIFY